MTVAEALEKKKIGELVKNEKAFIVGNCQVVEDRTKTGAKYYRVSVNDPTGRCTAMVWNNLPIFQEVEKLPKECYIEAKVKCTRNSPYINVEIESIQEVEKLEEKIIDEEALKNELKKEIEAIKDPDLKKLIVHIFQREEVKNGFFKSPATLKSAYSFPGGLLAHTIRLIRLSKKVAEVYNTWTLNENEGNLRLNEDLLVTASILHDIGKIFAFKRDKEKYVKTPEGELLDDSFITMKIVWEELEKIDIPQAQKTMIEHVLASSKGKYEYHALCLPRSREAVAFHLIDSLDTYMGSFEYMDREASADDEFVWLFDKKYFLGCYE